MQIYLAGPMRNYAEFNFPAFHAAAKRLREAGHEVFSPAERDNDVGFRPSGMAGSDADLAGARFDLRAALGADLAWITSTADAVVVLPGWEQSAGARAEVATARALSLPVYALEALLRGESELAQPLAEPPGPRWASMRLVRDVDDFKASVDEEGDVVLRCPGDGCLGARTYWTDTPTLGQMIGDAYRHIDQSHSGAATR
jgi:hypothetical protein